MGRRKIRSPEYYRAYAADWARRHYVPHEAKPRALKKTLVERFWEKVDKTETCWLWTAGCDGKGYGTIGLGRRTDGRARAHRLSWELNVGPIPPGMCVLHHCDTPRCVRPDHLFLGTMQENTQDMLTKGRNEHGPGYPSGEAHPNTKLTEAAVLEIRRRWQQGGVTQRALAQEFGVVHSVIGFVVRGETWRHLLTRPDPVG